MKKTIAKILKRIGIALVVLDLVYVVAVALVFNTPLFAKLTGMEDETFTHVRTGGVFSPFPGYLWMNSAKVGIRDQNVNVDIHIRHASVRFNPLQMLHKKLDASMLHVRQCSVDLLFKTPEETIKHLAEHTTDKDVDLELKKALGNAARETHFKLNFKHILIDKIAELKTAQGTFETYFSLDGGFRIQPGVEVEVFPTDLIIHSATLPGQFDGITGKAHVRFDPFFIPDAPGNAVFPFVNAELNLEGRAQTMRFINLTLKSLNQYSFEGEDSNFKMRLVVQKGVLQEGSFFSTSPSQMVLKSPNLHAAGSGVVLWTVDDENTSRLHSTLSAVHVKELAQQGEKKPRTPSPPMSGEIQKIRLDLQLYGNDLVDAFHGLTMSLALRRIDWKMNRGNVNGDGTILGYAGVIPQKTEGTWKQKMSDMNFKLSDIHLDTDFLPPMRISGDVKLRSKPIDFSVNAVVFPDIKTNLKIDVAGNGKAEATTSLKNTNYFLAPTKQWKGHADLNIKDTTPFVAALEKQNKFSGMGAKLAKVENLDIDFDWEMGQDFSWFHFNKVRSSGAWTAYGSFYNNDEGPRGAFEAKVAGLPVGIRLTPNKTETSFLPSREWYQKTMQ